MEKSDLKAIYATYPKSGPEVEPVKCIDVLAFNVIRKVHTPEGESDANDPESKGHTYIIEGVWEGFRGVALMKLVSVESYNEMNWMDTKTVRRIYA